MPSTKTHCAQWSLAFFCLVILLLSASDSIALHRSQGSVSGLVVDSLGKGLGNVSVTLLRAKDSTLVKGTISSADGKYLFQHTAGV